MSISRLLIGQLSSNQSSHWSKLKLAPRLEDGDYDRMVSEIIALDKSDFFYRMELWKLTHFILNPMIFKVSPELYDLEQDLENFLSKYDPGRGSIDEEEGKSILTVSLSSVK